MDNYYRPQSIDWQQSDPPLDEPPSEFINFDFSNYFLLLVFNGYRGSYGSGFRIKELWQKDEIMYISADIDDNQGTLVPIASSSYNVLKVSKHQMTQLGKITFVLLDQDGEERDRKICTIPPIRTVHPGELVFEQLTVSPVMKEEDIPVQMHVMTSNESPLPDVIYEIPAEGQIELDGTDYSQNFTLFVFTGKQNFGDVAHKVTQIWQTDNIIYIHANFPKPTKTVIPGFIYGKFVIKVSKDNMTQFGEIKFILIDQDERQRAVTTCDIPE
jgi:hypothetical protein